ALSQPADSSSPGGKLARLRTAFGLAQANLGEVDPTSETMRLATLGLKNVAVTLLWDRVNHYKKVEDWTNLSAALEQMTKLQPNFYTVWDFQAHNLSYNISVEFDYFESRYHWVKKGIRFLTGGIGYNRKDHRITDNLGMFTGMKIGNADEKRQYRRLFRKDTEFHDELAPFIEPDAYDTRQFGHDHWLMAWHWYDKSRALVEDMSAKPQVSDLIFYMKQPAQKRNQVMALQQEFRSDEQIKQIWISAREEWEKYGKRPLRNSQGVEITLNGLAEANEKVQRLRDQLDEMAPGARAEFVNEIRSKFTFSESDQLILDKPADQRTDEENARVRSLLSQISNASEEIDVRVFQRVEKSAPEKMTEARDLLNQLLLTRQQLFTIDRDQGTSNYVYWSFRNNAESQDQTIAAHQKLFDATELQRKSLFDDEYQLENGEKKILRRGAISEYIDAFAAWAKVLDDFGRLREGDLADTLVDKMVQFEDILKISGTRWPMDFPLQEVIDERAKNGLEDELPTTEELEEERSAREESSSSGEAPPAANPGDQPQPADAKPEDAGEGGGQG
ncbi:MAG: hypothetical protein ACK55S_09735, partial [Planctomycetota bacterium]